MSLDVSLVENDLCVYDANITHNLTRMADKAGIYEFLWRPEDIGITHAKQLIEPLTDGVTLLATEKARFEAFNSPNGWGTWEHFLLFCARYLQACKDYPEALVQVSR